MIMRRMTAALMLMSISEAGTVGVIAPGITVHGIRHGTATGIVPITGAGEVTTADGIHHGITTGIGRTMAGVDIMADTGAVTTADIMADIMADGGTATILITTGLTIVTSMDAPQLRAQATVMQAAAGRPEYVLHHHREAFRRSIAGARRFETVVAAMSDAVLH